MKYVPFIAFVLLSFFAKAQIQNPEIDTTTQRQFFPRQLTLPLYPIIIEGGKYFYDGHRVQFEDVVLLLNGVDDPILEKRMKTVRTLNDFRKVLRYVNLAFLLLVVHQSITGAVNPDTGFIAIVGVFAFNELYALSITLMKKKTINRYNDVVLQPSFSFNNRGGQVGVRIRF
jgi:hypothetical protein